MADIQKLETDLKETNRLQKILDEYTTSEIKRLSEDIIANKNALKNLEKKVLDLEKKQKK